MHFRKTTFILSLIGCLFLLPSAFAEQSGDFTYTVSGDNRAIAITGYTGSGGAVVIPETIDNKPVVSIGDGAFAEHLSLASIIIPNSVASIEDGAFSYCTKLTSAYFCGNAPLMGADVFICCATTFTVYYSAESTGFTSPAWRGYPSEIFSPACPDTLVLEADNPKLENPRDLGDSKLDQSASARKILLFHLLQQSRPHQ